MSRKTVQIEAESFMTALRVTASKFKRLQDHAQQIGDDRKSAYYAGVAIGLDHAFELTEDFIKLKEEVEIFEGEEYNEFAGIKPLPTGPF